MKIFAIGNNLNTEIDISHILGWRLKKHSSPFIKMSVHHPYIFLGNNSQIQSIFKNTLGFKFDQNNFFNARTYVLVLCENLKL